MKLTNKRLVSILLCLAMVLAMLPMAVFAATDYYLRGSMNGWGADDSNKMTDNGDGTYSITMDLAAGTYEFKGAIADWSWSCPGSNMTLTLAADDTVTFTLNPTANTLTYTLGSGAVVETSYYLVGSMNGWSANDNYKLTGNGDGTYSLTIDLAADTYEYKVKSSNNEWFPGGDNVKLTLDADDTVTFTLNPASGALTYTLGSGAVVEVLYYVVGGFNSWGETNKMTANDDGSYSATFAVAAGTYEYKVKNTNNEWFPGGDNLALEVTSDCEVTFVLKDGVVTATGEGVPAPVYDYFVAGSKGLVGVEWDPAGVKMTQNENGLYAVSFENIAAGDYEFKVTTGSWDTPAYGDNGNNYALTVDNDGSTVNIYFNVENSAILVDVVAPAPESTAPEALVLGSNNYAIAAGDTNAVSSTYIVEKDGILSVSVSAMTTPDGEVPAAYIPMQFGRQYALLVNGEQVWLPCEIEVAEGDEVEIGVMSYMGNETSCTIDLAIADPVVPGADQIKWQITAGTNAESESTSLRFVSFVDSLDYSKVIFNVTYGGETKSFECTTAYSAIIAAGVEINDVTSVFGEDAAYFITASMDVPAEAFDGEISVTVTRVALDGTETTSEARSIVVSDAFV